MVKQPSRFKQAFVYPDNVFILLLAFVVGPGTAFLNQRFLFNYDILGVIGGYLVFFFFQTRSWPRQIFITSVVLIGAYDLVNSNYRSFYGVNLDWYFCLSMIPSFHDFVIQSYSIFHLTGFYCITLGGIALLIWGLCKLLPVGSGQRRTWNTLALLIMALFFFVVGKIHKKKTLHHFAPSTLRIFKDSAVDFALAFSNHSENKKQFRDDLSSRADLPWFNDADLNAAFPGNVYIFDIESYSDVFFRKTEFRQSINEVTKSIAETISAKGSFLHGGYLESPIWGSGSWMADQSFHCGYRIDKNWKHEVLFLSDKKCFPKFFKKAGWEVVDVRGSTLSLSSEAHGIERLYGYTKHYYWNEFNYQGKRFGFSKIPDQVVIEHIKNEIDSSKHFIFFQLSSSHYPYNELPEYMNDLSLLRNGSIASRSFENIQDGYQYAIGYVLKSIHAFIKDKVTPEDIVIIFGDHQPAHGLATPESNYTPIHIISNRPKFSFLNEGWPQALSPANSLPMEAFLRTIFTEFELIK
tara:strand:+ start:443 stop:2008 length:1566 start_codon:yes stop_codon:yes gene_type:complete